MKAFCFSILFSISFFSLTAQSYDSLDANNIHAGFNAAGDLFYNINTGTGHIATPGNKVQYSVGNLWISGLDGGGQLHTAAQTYRQNGTDFWPGPLDTINVSCDTFSTHVFNKVWKLNCSSVDSFVGYTQGQGPAGYTVPMDIQTWPGNGDQSLAQVHYLAPFYDVDGDGSYNWTAGDYPVVRGTQSLFYVYNDALTNQIHTESGGQKLGVEIQAMPYAFYYPWDNALMNTIFIHYTIINRSLVAFNSARIGFWSDLDLSSAQTRSGSDSLLDAFYNYGSDNAAGVMFLNTSMSGFIAYQNNSNAVGNPASSSQYNNYLQQAWKDGSPLTFGGSGYAGNTQTNWMFSGDPVTGNGWIDNSGNNTRSLGSTNSFTFLPKMVYTFDVALVFANDSSPNFSSVNLLKQYMQQVKTFYQTNSQICTPGLTSIAENNSTNAISVSPNPANESVTIQGISSGEHYTIFNSFGQIVLEGKSTGINTQIDISSFSNGLYFIQIEGKSSDSKLKFIKTN
jgi:hypothetical protein